MDQNSKEFKELQAEWDAKLAKSGFKDAENRASDTLNDWHGSRFINRHAPASFAATEEYYQMAGRFLYDKQWETKVDRRIWELYAAGETVAGIAKILKRERFSLRAKSHIHRKIQKFAKEMLENVGFTR
jgi:hypothetical protein